MDDSGFRITRPGEVNLGRVLKVLAINDLAWSVIAPRDVVCGMRHEEVFGRWGGFDDGNGNNVTRIVGVLGSKPNKLICCR